MEDFTMKNELYEKLTQLQWLLHKQQLRSWAEFGPMADTSRGQGRILAMLKIKDGISTKDLSYLLGVRVSSLNEMLSKMEKNGFITREPSEQDKRVMLVYLTEKGREEQQEQSADMNDIFDSLTAAEQALFSEYLDRIISKLTEGESDVKEDMKKKMDSLKSRFGEMGEVFMDKCSGFAGRWESAEPKDCSDSTEECDSTENDSADGTEGTDDTAATNSTGGADTEKTAGTDDNMNVWWNMNFS